MHLWIEYISERFYVPTFAALVAGISLSGIYLNGNVFNPLAFAFSFIGILVFFALKRLIDDVKDVEKDRIAHPTRPLPRGLIKKPAAQAMIFRVLVVMFAFSMIIWVILNNTAGLAYVCMTIFLWLLWKDFFSSDWLHRHPLIYSVLLQLFIFPVVLFAVGVIRTDAFELSSSWMFASMLFGAFFCNEICRKLDPHAHPIIASFVHFYGFHRTFEIATLSLAVSAMAATGLNLGLILLPCELIVLISLSLLFFQQRWFKVPEIIASLSLMLHAWAIVLNAFFQ